MPLEDIINSATFVAFFVLMGLAVVRMAVRIILYRAAGVKPSVVLKRDIVLLGTLLFVFGSPLIITYAGWEDLFFTGGSHRIEYVLLRNIIGVLGLGYWVWVEYFVIGQPGKDDA